MHLLPLLASHFSILFNSLPAADLSAFKCSRLCVVRRSFVAALPSSLSSPLLLLLRIFDELAAVCLGPAPPVSARGAESLQRQPHSRLRTEAKASHSSPNAREHTHITTQKSNTTERRREEQTRGADRAQRGAAAHSKSVRCAPSAVESLGAASLRRAPGDARPDALRTK